jgi:hypothetical protein
VAADKGDFGRNEMKSVPQGLKARSFCWVYVRAEARTYPPVEAVRGCAWLI